MATSQSARSQVSGTRERILSAAIDLFGERGYAGTSVRDISDRLGVTKAALYYHFPSKETILDALIAPFLREIDQLVEFVRSTPPPPVEMIFERLVDAMAGAGGVLFAFANDPSVIQRRIGEHGTRDVIAQYEEIVRAVAGPEANASGVMRARCAVGCVKAGVFDSALSKMHLGPAAGGRPGAVASVAGVADDGPGHAAGGCFMAACAPSPSASMLLSDEERRVVVAAALAAFHS